MKEGKKIMVAADRRKEKSRKVEREIEKSRGGKLFGHGYLVVLFHQLLEYIYGIKN